MENLAVTSRRDWIRPGRPSACRAMCGGHLNAAQPQTEALPELRAVHILLWIRMLAVDKKKHITKLSAFHTSNLRRILRISWPRTISSKEMQARDHGLHLYEKKMAMDRTHHQKRTRLHHKNSSLLDPWRQTKERQAKQHLEANCGNRNENPEPQLGHSTETCPRWI